MIPTIVNEVPPIVMVSPTPRPFCFANDASKIATSRFASDAANVRPCASCVADSGPIETFDVSTPATEDVLTLSCPGVTTADDCAVGAPVLAAPWRGKATFGRFPLRWISERSRPPAAPATPSSFAIVSASEASKEAWPGLVRTWSREMRCRSLPAPTWNRPVGGPPVLARVTVMSVPTP